MQVATGSGGPPPPPPPGTHYVLDSALLRTNRQILEAIQEQAVQNRLLQEAALEVENRRLAEAKHESAVQQERHEELRQMFRQELNPAAAHMEAIEQGVASLHGAAQAVAAASQHHAQMANTAAEQMVIAARQAAEALAQRPERPLAGPEQPPGRKPLTAAYFVGPSDPGERKRPAEAAASAERAIEIAPRKALRKLADAAATRTMSEEPPAAIEDRPVGPGYKAPVHISEHDLAPLTVAHNVRRNVLAIANHAHNRSRSRIVEVDESGSRPIPSNRERAGLSRGRTTSRAPTSNRARAAAVREKPIARHLK